MRTASPCRSDEFAPLDEHIAKVRSRAPGRRSKRWAMAVIDPRLSDLMRAGAKLHLGPKSQPWSKNLKKTINRGSPLPREMAVSPGRRTREKRRNWAHFVRRWPTGRSGDGAQPKSYALAFMATEHSTGSSPAVFLVGEENGPPEVRRDLDAMFLNSK